MVHVPLRGLFMLGRVAFVVAAAAAVPYLLRKNRRLGEQLGDSLIKAGESLKKEAGASDGNRSAKSTGTDSPPATKEGVAARPRASRPKPSPKAEAARPAAKRPPAKKASAKRPSAKRPGAKSAAAKKSAAKRPATPPETPGA